MHPLRPPFGFPMPMMGPPPTLLGQQQPQQHQSLPSLPRMFGPVAEHGRGPLPPICMPADLVVHGNGHPQMFSSGQGVLKMVAGTNEASKRRRIARVSGAETHWCDVLSLAKWVFYSPLPGLRRV